MGAGHAHAALLAAAAAAPLYGARVTVVSPAAAQLYSGMLPGVIAGHYRAEEASFDVAALALRAFADFVPGEVRSLDAARRAATLADGRELRYDLLSLDVGSVVGAPVPGSAEHAVPLKPFDAFLQRLGAARFRSVAIAGGVGGAEIALALRHRGAAVTLFSSRPLLAALRRELRRRGVDYREGIAIEGIEPGPVVLWGASRQEFDLVLWATGAAAQPWLSRSGLAADDAGFVLVDDTLRSVSHPEVFATGDCATLREHPVPRSGVYAVRQAATLEANLRAVLGGGELQPYRPQPRALLLVTCGARYAVASWGGLSAKGRWAWWWKNRIDRRWLRRLAGAS